MSTLACNQLTVRIAGVQVMNKLNLAVRPGEFWGLLGPNGIGKTTLLKCLAGLHEPVADQKVKVDDEYGIFNTSVLRGIPYRKQLYREDSLADPNEAVQDIPFYKKQKRLALHRNGVVDPCNIYDAIREDGYEGLAVCLSKTPDEVLETVKKANVRGRGGAGFPAGLKWEHTKKSGAKVKAVVCNGDEGDPGAFMDRSLMEGDPHSVLEGMIINAYAIGAQPGYLYVRHEYPLAVKNLGIAISQARALGLLGKNILGSGLDFDCEIKEGAGAFVCGESTALSVIDRLLQQK